MNKSRSELADIIGIGAFAYLIISAFYVLIFEVIRDLFIVLQFHNNLNFWITELVVLILFSITSYSVVKNLVKEINSSPAKTRKMFLTAFVWLFLIQILQFLYTYYGTNYVIENYTEKATDFYSYLGGNPRLGFYSSIFGLCRFLVFGLMIYTVKKLLPTVYKNNA